MIARAEQPWREKVPKLKMATYLVATPLIDAETPSIKEKVRDLVTKQQNSTETAKSIFYFVRDEIKYNPYAEFFPLEASTTLERGNGFCIQKAILLTAMQRAAGIPARLGFADIRNYLISEKMERIQKGNLFLFHGFTELYINDKWIKATPTFDMQMCQDNRFKLVEFDGSNNAVFHSHDLDGNPHVEYIHQHGSFADVPVETIIDVYIQTHGHHYFECWKTGDWDSYIEQQASD